MDADLSGSSKTKSLQRLILKIRKLQHCWTGFDGWGSWVTLSGHVVCASTFAMFAAGRSIWNYKKFNRLYECKCKVCATHAGYFGRKMVRAIKLSKDIAHEDSGMLVVNPADAVSAKETFKWSTDTDGPLRTLDWVDHPECQWFMMSSRHQDWEGKCNSGRQWCINHHGFGDHGIQMRLKQLKTCWRGRVGLV